MTGYKIIPSNVNMRNNRTQIDNFLLQLEAFVSKYHKHTDDIYDIENTFIPLFKANKDKKSFVAPNKSWLYIPTITMLCNPKKIGHIKLIDKSDLSKQFKKNRTSNFVQWVAYGLEYKMVKDVSYEHIFIKHLLKNSEKADSIMTDRYIHPNQLAAYDLKEFLVPVDYDTNDNLILY